MQPTNTSSYGSWNVGIGPGELTFCQLLGYTYIAAPFRKYVPWDMIASGSYAYSLGEPIGEGIVIILTCT